MNAKALFLLIVASLSSSAVIGLFSSITSRVQNNALVRMSSAPPADGAAPEWVGAKKFSMKDRYCTILINYKSVINYILAVCLNQIYNNSVQ